MKREWLASILVLGLSAASGHAQTQQDFDWCNGKNGATPQMQITGCTALIDSKKFPAKQSALILNNRADAFYRNKDLSQAIVDYTAAIELDANFLEPRWNRGNAYSAQGQHERAIADYDAAIKLNPKEAGPWNSRCYTRTVVGRDLRRALSDCNEALRLYPNGAGIFTARGHTYLKLGEYSKSIADYDAALKLLPKFPEALYGRGLAKLRKGDHAAGEADIAAAKAARPDVAEAFAFLAVK